MYHEVSQLFKKESRDFCVLQSEKVDGDKYIISLCSVGWPTSASSGEGTIRGQVGSKVLHNVSLFIKEPLRLTGFLTVHPLCHRIRQRCCCY